MISDSSFESSLADSTVLRYASVSVLMFIFNSLVSLLDPLTALM